MEPIIDRTIEDPAARATEERATDGRFAEDGAVETGAAEQVAQPPVPNGGRELDTVTLHRLLAGMKDLRDGNFRRRLVATGDGLPAELAAVFNEIAERNQQLAGEMARVRVAVGKDERLDERVDIGNMQAGDDSTRERLRVDADSAVWTLRVDADGNSLDVWDGWAFTAAAMNGVIDDLLRPTTELSRVLAAAAEGDLSQRMPHPPVGSRPPGELGSLSTSVNSLLERLSAVADEVTRVAREVGTDGRLGGQAEVPGVAGTWRDLTDSVNFMADNLTGQVRNIAQVTTAVARGDLTQKINVDARGEILELKNTINTMVDQLSDFADEVTRVAREVGTEGILGGQ
ncbi:MAG: HAMP domain-containing protein, partial [Micromonosporaceae bacterium]